jgi:hypothetical protein
MPYIKKAERGPKAELTPCGAGQLNYALTKLIHRYWLNQGQGYQAINDIVGALEGAKLEFYRRVAAPYEDKKIAENGDVYPPEQTGSGTL